MATPADTFFSKMAQNTKTRCDSLVESFRSLSPGPSKEFVELLNGEETVEERILSMFDAARDLIVIKAPLGLSTKLIAGLNVAITRGVRCYLIFYGKPPELAEGDVTLWPHEGNACDMGKDLILVSVDKTIGLSCITEDFTATFSENSSFVYLADILLRHEIYLAEIMTAFKTDIDAHFGPALYKLRERYALLPLAESTREYIEAELTSKARTGAD
ncbi:hypothetical protein [Alloyangia mangrovi]|uniref:hypothetical protein n=1 Tax=Alloyangia mangrovi TaxID=1779329 RepID=UPI0021A3AE8B|nr:hypothetical protein [Alloyangia mangrovi]